MLLEWIALLFIAIGIFFSFAGVLGVMRMPDVYTRLHASGKVSMLGLFGLLIGVALLMPEIAPKLIGLGLFLLITSPVASHSIAAAAYRSGVPLARVSRDDLAAKRSQIVDVADELSADAPSNP
ncbi:MAG: monovalent cation/H(+) antiporter subunit G [Candidatus Flexifilum sp.]|jgi:multicomponent Na+:H+ antiporter subunit G